MTSQRLDQSEWLSIAEVAAKVGVTRVAVGKRLKRLLASGLIEVRLGAGGEQRMRLPEYEAAVDRTKNPLKSDAAVRGTPAREARRKAAAAGNSGVEPPQARQMGAVDGADLILADEQARRVRIDADLKELALRQKLGELIEVVAVREAMATAGGALARAIDQLTGMADEIASAVGKEGSAGARAVLKGFARTLRQRLASEMRLMVGRGEDNDSEAAEDEDDVIRFANVEAAKADTNISLKASPPAQSDDAEASASGAVTLKGLGRLAHHRAGLGARKGSVVGHGFGGGRRRTRHRELFYTVMVPERCHGDQVRSARQGFWASTVLPLSSMRGRP